MSNENPPVASLPSVYRLEVRGLTESVKGPAVDWSMTLHSDVAFTKTSDRAGERICLGQSVCDACNAAYAIGRASLLPNVADPEKAVRAAREALTKAHDALIKNHTIDFGEMESMLNNVLSMLGVNP